MFFLWRHIALFVNFQWVHIVNVDGSNSNPRVCVCVIFAYRRPWTCANSIYANLLLLPLLDFYFTFTYAATEGVRIIFYEKSA